MKVDGKELWNLERQEDVKKKNLSEINSNLSTLFFAIKFHINNNRNLKKKPSQVLKKKLF